MPYADVFTQINREYYHLTSAEKKIADYLLSNRDESQFISISDLAGKADVAEATVSRFCRRLGYKGYGAFKLAMASAAAQGGNGPLYYGEVQGLDTIGEMCRKVCANDVDAITQTLSLIQAETLSRTADRLLASDKVLCMGQGGSMILAQEAAHLFSTILPNFYAVSDSHTQMMRAATLTERDTVLYFSYSGSTRELVDVMRVIRSRGAVVVIITRFPNSPGAAQADIVLECGSRETHLHLGSIAAKMGQLYLVDVLFNEVCRRNVDICMDRRRQVAGALADMHL